MSKKSVISVLLAVCIVLPVLATGALAGGRNAAPAASVYTAEPVESTYFYEQLGNRAKAIYDKLLEEFTGEKRETYYTGEQFIDLMGISGVDQTAVEAYIAGNRDLFNDFCAAKDALDLDHSELWYIDSGYLTFRVTQDEEKTENNGYHVLVGPGRGETYLLGGEELAGVEDMDTTVNKAIDDMVTSAVNALDKNSNASGFSESDKIAYLVGHVHDQITKGLHYRYEIECSRPENAKFIRTIYGSVTHEGVCEAYARTLQVALTRMGVECVLIHGVQSKGTPEDHMWNAVNIPDSGGEARWYVVDATWDDPLTAKWDGSRDLDFNNGLDGRETNTYLLVGETLVGEYWNPSGYVSTGNFEFTYPTIETASFSGETVFGDDNGLKVQYSAGGSQEDNIPAGVFSVTYQGMDAAKAREKGLYFLVKMYDYHPDGTADVMDEWYYADATFVSVDDENPYFGDYGGTLRIFTSTCEYVEIAVTTREPEGRDTWENAPTSGTNALSNNPEVGYFQGDESEIIVQSGMLYNVNSSYEAPPYVKTQTPAPNGNATAGVEYRFKVTYDDLLYHILPSDEDALNGLSTADIFEDNYEQAKHQPVQVRYTTNQQDLHDNNIVKPHTVVGDLPFDENRDGVVDMDSAYTDFHWIYASDDKDEGGLGIKCPNKDHHTSDECDVNAGCPIVGVEFNFRASDQWIDDVTEYNFTIEGVVGSRSSKYPNNFATIAVVPGLCPACYRSEGIDWNLWGRPTLLDAPENLDLHAMAEAGGTDPDTLKKLDEEMNRDDLNGRLMLVVEDKSKGAGNREEYEKIDGYLEKSGQLEGEDVAFSSVFEINFNRLCPAVNLKPNKGQSLRVQVGYPAGITYESLGRGEYDIKAYHFTRCSDDEGYRCEHAGEEGHKWGDDIIGVQEITLIPTPYGIVIMCDAFSPFEIVAVKKDDNAISTVSETEHDVIVVSDMNGVVTYTDKNGKEVEAVGENGNLKVADGGTFTFSVSAKDGYVVDTVSFGGESVEADADGAYTLKDVKKSDVLSVTFLPQDVKEAEEETYGATVVTDVCPHTDTEVSKEAVPATCTQAGWTEERVCKTCGMVVQKQTAIPATGHKNITETQAAVAATCTQSGYTAELTCWVCGQKISTRSTIQALGHLFTRYTETGAETTCQGTEVQATCDRAGCNATDTRFEDRNKGDHRFTKLVEHIDATCTNDSVDVLQCEWCEETTVQTKAGTATGHDWGENGYCTKCGAFKCSNGHTLEKLPGDPATCTENGLTEGERCSVCGEITKEQEVIPATGHTWGENGYCTVCKAHRCENRHTLEELPAVPATCDKNGLTEGQHCTVCGEVIEKQEVIEKLHHTWDTEHITWHWSETNDVSATAEVSCTVCGHTEIHTAEMSNTPAVGKEPTCTGTGEGTYTATVLIDGEEYTDNDGGKTLPIPALGHDWDKENPIDPTEATCTHHATAKYKCKRCGAIELIADTEQKLPSHKFVSDHNLSVAATCTTAGEIVGVCSVCGATGSMSAIPALGHDYVNGVCTRCGAAEPEITEPEPTEPEPTEPAKPAKHPVIRTYNAFKDVPAGSWYEEDLKFSYERGLISGTGTDTFSPDDNIKRVEWMALLARFDFVAEAQGENWDAASMDWAVGKNISDGSNPDGDITREELVTMLWRYSGCPKSEASLEKFADAGKISVWAPDAFRWAVEKGIIGGVSATELDPQGKAIRAQAAAIFARFVRMSEGEQ